MPVTIYEYSEDHLEVLRDVDLATFEPKPAFQYWIRVNAPTPGTKNAITRLFDLHPLALEDYEEGDQRPKIDHYRTYDYLVFQTIHLEKERDEEHDVVETAAGVTQVNVFFRPRTIITLHEQRVPVLDRIAELLEIKTDFVIRHEVDYLLCAILDHVVDDYFPVIDQINDEVEQLEDAVEDEPHPTQLELLNDQRRALIRIQRVVRAERDVVRSIISQTHKFFSESVLKYFRDIFDHLLMCQERVDTNREYIVGIRDTYHNTISNRTNQIVALLTILSTVFLPLTFITGLYGMNFQHMPELQTDYGYFVVLGVMAAITVLLLVYFKKRDWI